MATNNTRSRDSSANLASKKKDCYTFEPQQWRRSVCKNCFRSLPDHPTEPPANSNPSGNNGKGLSPRTSPLLGTKSGSNAGTTGTGNTKDVTLRKNETSPTTRRRPKSDEFKQKTPSPRESKRNISSNSASGRRSPATSPSSSVPRLSGSFSSQNRQSSTSSIDAKYVEELENDFFDLEDKFDELSREKADMEKDVADKECTIEQLQEDIESYKIKILHFERRVQHLEEEIRNYRERLKLPESDQANVDVGDSMNRKNQELVSENEQLRLRLEEIEQLCQEVMEENEMLKEEQEEMQREIEEMHDHFQEDDTDTLRELKRDLETSNKNCRIFQFKLRKTERRYEQCENERAVLEEKLNRLEAQLYSENDVNLIRGLEEELRVAKEVSVRLNSELELVDEKRAYFEEDNKHLKDELKDSDARRKTLEIELSRCRQEIEKLKSMEPTGALQIPETTSMRRGKNIESLSREPSFEEQSLQRELDAAKERERDLNEQLKFAEDEIRKMKRRLNDAEEENDSLSKKLESVIKVKNLEDSDYEDASLQAIKIQVELLEQENLKLINDLRQMKSKNQDGEKLTTMVSVDENIKGLEKKLSDLQTDVERLEKENRRLTVLCNLNQNSSNSKLKGGEFQSTDTSTDFIQNSQIQELRSECSRLKEQVKTYDKQIKSIMTQMDRQDTDKKQLDVFKKYNETILNCKEHQRQIVHMQNIVDNLKSDVNKYKEFYDKNYKSDQKLNKQRRNETRADLENASKAILLDEIICLEDEIDELASKCEKAELRITTLTNIISDKEKTIDEMLNENEKNDREMNQYIEHLLTKNALLSDLLNCVETRANELQLQFDRQMSNEESAISSGDSSSTTTSTTTTTDNSSAGTFSQVPAGVTAGKKTSLISAGSDDVFNDSNGCQINVPGNLNDAEKIKFRLSCLERLLSEERKRTRIAEKQAEMALKDSAHSRVNEDSQLKKKEIEMLKNDLEEKNEMLEEKEQQIQDLKTRLEQTRKMNEALRTLLDKQDETSSGSSLKSREGISKEKLIEINSYKKEIAALKNDIHQYGIKINESEKVREKLAKEIRNLQAEIKVREEQIYEQDDEMRVKDHEIRNLKKLLEEAQNNLKSQNQTSVTSNKLTEKIEEIEAMKKKIEELIKANQNYKNQNEELEIEIRQNENQRKILSDSVRTRDERIKEKDDLISHINQRLQNREKELNDFDAIIKQSNDKLEKSQEALKDIQVQLSQKEIDLKSLKSKYEELQKSYDNVFGNLNGVKKENEKLKSRISDLEKEKTKPPVIPRISVGTGSVDVEKLKSEIVQLKKDKEVLSNLIGKDKSYTAVRRDSDTSKNESESYTRAIQQQQYVTRVNLLTDNVSRLNRVNIELKLQNESIQNDMLEYQRKYKNIKEQYDAEQESWVAERITLESRMKEYEDRKSVIASLRKSLQDASLKVVDLETQINKEKQESMLKLADMERTKNDLEKKISQFEEQQKLPKVLQRFGGKVTSKVSESLLDKEKAELKVRLEAAEKSIQKLRAETIEKEEKFGQEKSELLKKSEETRQHLDSLVQNLTNQLAEMEGCREQVFLLKERIFTIEENQERERKIWNEERMSLHFKLEESRVLTENWLNKIRSIEVNESKPTKDVMEFLEKEFERQLSSKESVPYSHMRRRIEDRDLESVLNAHRLHMPLHQTNSSLSSVPSSPNNTFGKSPLKAISLDWTNRMTRSQHTPDIVGSNQSINITSFTRSNRSVSPESSKLPVTRKVTNYPDPTPGFLLRSSSRQSSIESVNKEPIDYTQRSFTLPGLRNNRNASRMSPARQKFFETSNFDQTHTSEDILYTEKHNESIKEKVTDSKSTPPQITIKSTTPVTSSDSKKVIKPTITGQSQVSEKSKPEEQSNTISLINTQASGNSKSTTSLSGKGDMKTTKSKSISIAPSIQQLRLKFAQKNGNSSSFDSSSKK